jgi:hypothetical protein
LVALTLGLGVGFALPLPDRPKPDPAPPPSATDAELLAQAIAEAHANCNAATLVAWGFEAPALKVQALLTALGTGRLEAQAHGELEAIYAEGEWLSTLEPRADTPQRSWEDVRFLLGAIHDYLVRAQRPLERNPALLHHIPPERYDPTRLRAFRGLDFGDLLGLWD